MKTIEYRVKKVNRYIVTRFEHEVDTEDGTSSGSSQSMGEFEWELAAYNVAEALGMKDNAHMRDVDVIFPLIDKENLLTQTKENIQ